MKSVITILFVLFTVIQANAQSEKYLKAMEPKVAAMDTTHSFEGLQELGNGFERIAEAEKNQWLPFYYSAVSNVMMGFMLSNGTPGSGNTTQSDQIADKAEIMLNKAEELEKENSDIYCVKKMIATLRMMADPMTRYQTYGPQAAEALAKAKTLNPNNPRVYLLEGQDKFYTPEQFGGSKTEARVLFEESIKKFEENKPKSAIDPHWGLSQAKYFYDQAK
jgi:hypothetical protein